MNQERQIAVTPLIEPETQNGSLRAHLVRGVIGTTGLRTIEKVLALFIAISLARLLGPEGYGYYAYATSLIALIAVPGQLGLPQLLTREISAGHVRRKWSLMRGLYQRAVFVATLTVLLGMIAGFILLISSGWIAALDKPTFAWALVLLPLSVSLACLEGVVRGLRYVVQAQWPAGILRPSIFLLLVWVVATVGAPLTSERAVVLNIAALAIATSALGCMSYHYWPRDARFARPEFDTRRWTKSVIAFTSLAGVNVLNQKTDTLMLGILSGTEDVGVYQIVVHGGMLVSFLLATVNTVLAPNVVRLYAKQDHHRLQRLLSISTVFILFGSSLVFLVLLFFGELLLSVFFGEAFVPGYPSLIVFSLGQLVNAGLGSVGLMLTMTGHEKDTLKALIIATVINVALNGALIPAYGLMGAALATASSTVVWNVILARDVYRRLDILPGPWIRRGRTA